MRHETAPVGIAPRISIHAFCETPETLRAIEASFADRRLFRVHGSVHMGGIDAATRHYAETSTPNVLVLETHKGRNDLMAALAGLASVCDPTTKAVVIGHVNDVVLYRELMAVGISEYIVAPAQPLNVIEAVLALFADPNAAPLGRVIAFIGARGGVGSSTIAHNVAWTLAESLDEDVTIADFDLAFGTAALNFNVDALQGVAEALSAPDRVDSVLIDRLLTKCTERLSLLAAPAQLGSVHEITVEAVDVVLAAARNSVPCIIADLPTLWSDWTRHILTQADDVVITSVPDLASLRNSKALVDYLRTARPNDQPPRLVLNQTGQPKRTEIPSGEFLKVLGLDSLTSINFDAPLFTTAANNGQMLTQVASGSKPVEMINQLAALISGRRPAVKPSRFSLAPLVAKLPLKRKAG